jgi:dienelactone hydrolase
MRRLVILLSLFLCSALIRAAEPEERTWTARQTGKPVIAQFLSLDNGYLTLRLQSKRTTKVALQQVSDDDHKYVLSLMDQARTWTMAQSGASESAHFIKANGDYVVLLTPAMKSIQIKRSRLSQADQQYLLKVAPLSMEQILLGTWEGVTYSTGYANHHSIEVKMVGGRLKGYDTISMGYTEDEIAKAKTRRLKDEDGRFLFGHVTTQNYNITAPDSNVTFTAYQAKYIYRGPGRDKNAKWSLDTLVGKYQSPGIIVGDLKDKDGRIASLYLTKKGGGYDNAEPTTLARGKTHKRTCTYDPRFHFTLYIPKSYDPSKPSAVLVNDSAGANANPLSPKMAEETGWIMVGLTESSNGKQQRITGPNCYHALLDVRRMLNIHPRRYYFSGMSGGARRAATRGNLYARQCAGVICIGAAYSQWLEKGSPYYASHQAPALSIPVFFIVGKSDMNNGEVTSMHSEAKAQGRKTEIIIHPGGHTWGRAADHEAAISWLDKQWRE